MSCCAYKVGQIGEVAELRAALAKAEAERDEARAEAIRRGVDTDRQWCANIDAVTGGNLEEAAAATISQLRAERDQALKVVEAARTWRGKRPPQIGALIHDLRLGAYATRPTDAALIAAVDAYDAATEVRDG